MENIIWRLTTNLRCDGVCWTSFSTKLIAWLGQPVGHPPLLPASVLAFWLWMAMVASGAAFALVSSSSGIA